MTKAYADSPNPDMTNLRVIEGGKVSTLKINESASAAAPELSEQLPNLEKSEPVDIALNKSITITLGLKKGWHINADAPSYLALFALEDNNEFLQAQFAHDQLKQKTATLPALNQHVYYRLQGTLYYCENKAGARCLIKSFDMPIKVKPGGEKTIMLKLN